MAFPDIGAQMTAVGHGNGNFVTVANGNETVLYAHLQPGSLNPKVLLPNATVQAGDYLGRAGSSGWSTKPHLHIHANETKAIAQSWDTIVRPMVFRGAHAVAWTALGANVPAAPWVPLNGRGLPQANCAVWPDESAPLTMRYAEVRHMAIGPQGQLWVVRTDNWIMTTHDRLPGPPGSGVYLNVDTGGRAREIALILEKPYIIGTDNRLGLVGGLAILVGSHERAIQPETEASDD